MELEKTFTCTVTLFAQQFFFVLDSVYIHEFWIIANQEFHFVSIANSVG